MRPALLAILLCCACAHRTRTAEGKPVWYEVQTEHFTLHADTTEADARLAAARLERVRDGLLAASWHARTEAKGRVQVVLLEDLAELEEFFPRGFQGAKSEDPFGQLVIVASAEQGADVPVLKHELAHAIGHGFLLREPRWLGEGLASYLETAQVTDKGIRIGDVNHDALGEVQRMPKLAFEDVLHAGPDIYTKRPEVVSDFYARSWLLVHLLVNRHREQFDAFLGRLAKAEDPAAAFAASFPGLGPRELSAEAEAYVGGGAYSTVSVAMPVREVPETVRVLAPAEVLAWRAQLWVTAASIGVAKAPERAVADAAAAMKLDAGEPLAAAIWAEQSKATSEQRIAAAQAATAARPADARAWTLLAEALQDRTDAARISAVEKAAALAPEDPRVLVQLVDVRILQRRYEEALKVAVQANRLAPGRAPVLDAVATALAANGRCDDAVRLETRAGEVIPDGAPPEAVQQVRERITLLGEECRRTVASMQPVVAPKRLSCAAKGPRVPVLKGVKPGTVARIRYHVGKDGLPSGFTDASGMPPPLLKALTDFVAGCRFEPARQAGAAIEADMEEAYELGPQR